MPRVTISRICTPSRHAVGVDDVEQPLRQAPARVRPMSMRSIFAPSQSRSKCCRERRSGRRSAAGPPRRRRRARSRNRTPRPSPPRAASKPPLTLIEHAIVAGIADIILAAARFPLGSSACVIVPGSAQVALERQNDRPSPGRQGGAPCKPIREKGFLPPRARRQSQA